MAISVLPVTSREEGMKFISQLSVPLSSVDKYTLYQLFYSEVGLSGTWMVLRAEEAISIDFFNFCLSPTSKRLTSFFEGKPVTLCIYNLTSNFEVISLLLSTTPPFSIPFHFKYTR